ncbi:MAG: YicC/YloC family endoribonuclease [Bacillota bacterium]|nr:YicC/YloC family endoribonuclease [Bacillota bacterium]
MIRSMTGFGRGEYKENGKEFLVEIKTVNHRYSDIFLKLPRQISFLEDKVRDTVNKSLSRGKIDVYVSFEEFGEDSKSVLLDEPLAKAYVKSLETLRDKFHLKDDISLSLVARFPDILKVEKVEADEDVTWQYLKKALDNALDSLVKMREIEGEGLKKDMIERAEYIRKIVNKIDERAPEVVKEYKLRLENRIKELMDQQVVDENRLATEIAIFADRCSINEELVRLDSHIKQLIQTLNQEQPVGRKLDFLVQEMNREINTIGSKSNDLDITRNVVEIKSEIEKIREQVQNIE